MDNDLVAKFPVVIAEPEVQIDLESFIELDEPALEIKRVKKNVFLTQCKLIVLDSQEKGKLFLSGFVRESIEYASIDKEDSEKKILGGFIRHITVSIPFKCVTEVRYNTALITKMKNSSTEIEFFSDKLVGCELCNEHIVGHDSCESDFRSYESITEQVFYELIESKFYEVSIHREPVSLGCEFPYEQIFESFTEKTVLFIKIKLLQHQPVHIPSLCPSGNNVLKISKCGRVISKGKIYFK